MYYTCCALCAGGFLDAVGDLSTTKPPKCLLGSRSRPKGRGEAVSAPGQPQPAASACALSHPFTSPGNKVGLSTLYSYFWFCPCFKSERRLGEAAGPLHGSVKALGEVLQEGRARLAVQGCLRTREVSILGVPQPSDLLCLSLAPSGTT